MGFIDQIKKDKELEKAILRKDLEAVGQALENGASVDHLIRKGSEPFHQTLSIAFTMGFAGGGNRPIGLAIQKSSPEIVELLLKKGANPNERLTLMTTASYGADGWVSPLFYAIHLNKPEMVKALLTSMKTDPYRSGKNQSFLASITLLGTMGIANNKLLTPLEYAERKKYTDISRMIKSHIPKYKIYRKEQSLLFHEISVRDLKQEIQDIKDNAAIMGIKIEDTQDLPKNNLVNKMAESFKPYK